MTKLYFLSPDKQSATKTISDLRDQGVASRNISVLAHESVGLDTSLEVTELDETGQSGFGRDGLGDLVPALQKGAALGGGLGLVGGLAAMAFPPAGLIIGGGAVLATTAFGAGFGAWTSSLIGISAPHHDIEEYVTAVENGSILLLVDVDADNVEAVKTTISRHHPEVDIKENGAFAPVSS